MKSNYPLSLSEFKEIYSKVVRLTVEILIFEKNKGVFMTLRDIEPCKGMWHLPGGTVLFGERLSEALNRLAKRELGIDVKRSHLVGYIEYPSHFEKKIDHPVGLVFEVDEYKGTPTATTEAKAGKWFLNLPAQMHPEQDQWLLKNKYIQK